MFSSHENMSVKKSIAHNACNRITFERTFRIEINNTVCLQLYLNGSLNQMQIYVDQMAQITNK